MSLAVVCFAWSGKRPIYTPWHVENVRRMYAKHLTTPHRFVCVSDNPEVPGYWPIWPAPAVEGRSTLNNFVRLGLFGRPGREIGGRILLTDLDIVIRSNIDSLVTADPLKVWDAGRAWIQGGLVQLVGGMYPWLWAAAHNQALVEKACERFCGTDQAVLSYFCFHAMRRGEIPSWTAADGITIREGHAWRMLQAAAFPKPWAPESNHRAEYYRQSGRELGGQSPARLPGPRRHRLHRARRLRISRATNPAEQTETTAPGPATAHAPLPDRSWSLRQAVARLFRH